MPCEFNYGDFGSRDSSLGGNIDPSKSLAKRLVEVQIAKSQGNKISEAVLAQDAKENRGGNEENNPHTSGVSCTPLSKPGPGESRLRAPFAEGGAGKRECAPRDLLGKGKHR